LFNSLSRIIGGTLLATAVSLSGSAVAEDYPNRSIRVLAPLAPGGAVDILARLVSDRLAPVYGQSIIVENKPGASGHVGAQSVAKAPGDGYTLMVGTIGIHAAYASYRKLAYAPATDLQPIMILGEAPNLVLVPANSPYKTFADFLADAKKRPGKLNYASAGPGTSIHMVTALFELAAGTQLNHVPYRGSGPALVDLIGERVDVMFDNMSSGMPYVRSGKLRVLATTGPKRDPRLPDVPTIAESGLPDYSGTSWFTLAAPSSVPRELIEKINRDVTKALASPEVMARFDSLGMTFTPNTPSQAAEYIKSETVKWNRVIKAANLQLD
jgi:tripartite-type tricarboxylate transporter receptor subunit TctC